MTDVPTRHDVTSDRSVPADVLLPHDVPTPETDAAVDPTALGRLCNVRSPCPPPLSCDPMTFECVRVCPVASAQCGAYCCGGTQICSNGQCVEPVGDCRDFRRCPPDSFCDLTRAVCVPTAGAAACERMPTPGVFDPVEKWRWPNEPVDFMPAANQVMVTPAVGPMLPITPDEPVPPSSVVFVSYEGTPAAVMRDPLTGGILRAISGRDGHSLWPLREPGYRVYPFSNPAMAELDAAHPGLEIVVCSEFVGMVAGNILIIAADGSLIRRLPNTACAAPPAVADMDGDGVPEISAGTWIGHADGTVRRPSWRASPMHPQQP